MRYFIEVAYLGKDYAGFQVQDNARTIQYEVENALSTISRTKVALTGSSRTDAGVHARQNFFHFDSEFPFSERSAYGLNAILPPSISVLRLQQMPADAHSRFDAVGRKYGYYLYHHKNPFLHERAWFYPYPVAIDLLNSAAQQLLGQHDFTSFSKRNTQVKTMVCTIAESAWKYEGTQLVYRVQGNRFLRGMVRGLVATMLQVGRGKLTPAEFLDIIAAKDCTRADFSAPPHGLYLEQVMYPEGYFGNE